MFSLCAGTHLCTQGHTHLGVLALCVCVCVPSSWITAASILSWAFFSAAVIQFTVHLDRVLLGQMASQLATRKLTIFLLALHSSSLCTPCSFFWCRRRPQREENCFKQVEQEYCWSAMLLHCLPAKSEVKLNLTAASHTPFHLYDSAHCMVY